MATRDAAWVGPTDDGYIVVTWEGLLTTDVGQGINTAGHFNKSFQIIGNHSGSATIVMQGSNDDGTTWNTLHDATGALATYSANAFGTVIEQPLLIRPSVGAGDGSTDLKVIMVLMTRVN
jgi:hypothetical protein